MQLSWNILTLSLYTPAPYVSSGIKNALHMQLSWNILTLSIKILVHTSSVCQIRYLQNALHMQLSWWNILTLYKDSSKL
jgi:hypothetical protein